MENQPLSKSEMASSIEQSQQELSQPPPYSQAPPPTYPGTPPSGYTQQPGYSPQQQAHPPQQPMYSPQQQGHPPKQPGYAPQPGYSPQQPMYSPQQQGHLPKQPAYAPQPGYVQQPAQPAGYAPVQQQYVQHNQIVRPGQAVPQQSSNVVVVQHAQAQGNCPSCRNGFLVSDYTCLGVFLAIFFFPLGIICCLALTERRCTHCRARF